MMPVSKLEYNLIHRACVGDILTRAAWRFPERVAVKDGDVSLTFKELNERANRLGHALLNLGLAHQDRVGIMSLNSWQFLVSYFACAKAGLVAVPVNLGLKGAEIAYCLKDAQAKALIVDAMFAQIITPVLKDLEDIEHLIWCRAERPMSEGGKIFDRLLKEGDPAEVEQVVEDRDIVQLLYTSGTTSHPKGVLTSHVAVTITSLSSALSLKLDEKDTVLTVLPLFHCAQLNAITLPALLVGATTILQKSFDAKQVAVALERERVTMTALLPMMYAALLAEPTAQERDFSFMRLAIYAMAPMPRTRIQEIQDLFPNANILLGSGQTELTPPTTFQHPHHQWEKAASWGAATPSVQIGIMDNEGNLLPRGEIGEIVYRSPQAMEGYLNLPGPTEETFKHGWLHSGDVGYMDEEGVVWFTDRKKDMIKSGGENVASIEVERRLMEHPAVQEAAVVGLPHPRWGEAVTGVVILKPDQFANEEELIAFCKETLAGFKVPKRIKVVTEFPRTGTGKIQKHHLREQLKDLYTQDSNR
jgi:acyl-CoA synthetase (AMP-forming)/AMP-acid ligase II